MSSTAIEELVGCLRLGVGRFGNYQDIPEFVLSRLPVSFAPSHYRKTQLRLDEPRLRFLTDCVDVTGYRVVEIGSSLGYMGLCLAQEASCRYAGYEPIAAYARASAIMAQVAQLDDLCEFVGKPVGIDDITSLPDADLIIELNVLHHGGAVFDQDACRRLGGWRAYALARLAALAGKARWLFFQTGNTADGQSLFPTQDAVLYMGTLLEEAGWVPYRVGVIENLDRLAYVPVSPDRMHLARAYVCRRNEKTGLVDYRVDGKVVASLPTGLANRPIWICRRAGS